MNKLFEDAEHRVEVFDSRYFQKVTEIWCPNRDETKGVLGERYISYCPQCGEKLEDG